MSKQPKLWPKIPGIARTTVIPLQPCPACFKHMDAASHPEKEVSPKPGDLTMCLHCQTVLQFDRKLRVTIASKQAIESTPPDELRRLRRYQAAAAAAQLAFSSVRRN